MCKFQSAWEFVWENRKRSITAKWMIINIEMCRVHSVFNTRSYFISVHISESIKKRIYYLNKSVVSFKQPRSQNAALHIYGTNDIYSFGQCFIVCILFYNSHRHTSLYSMPLPLPWHSQRMWERFFSSSSGQNLWNKHFSTRHMYICCKGFMDLWARIY